MTGERSAATFVHMSQTPRTRAKQDSPILLRASITNAEWAALRKIAIDRNVPTQQLVAAALRVSLPLTPKEDSPA